MKPTIVIASFAALAACTAASAQTATSTPRPSAEQEQLGAKPAPEMNELKVFEGAWVCTGNQSDSVFGSAHPIQTNVTGKSDLGGFWISVRYQEAITQENDHPATGVYSYSYDPTANQFIAIWTDNLGGWGVQTSPGWQDNKLVLVGDYTTAGQKIAARDTFTKTNVGIDHLSELQSMGQWIPLLSESCVFRPA